MVMMMSSEPTQQIQRILDNNATGTHSALKVTSLCHVQCDDEQSGVLIFRFNFGDVCFFVCQALAAQLTYCKSDCQLSCYVIVLIK